MLIFGLNLYKSELSMSRELDNTNRQTAPLLSYLPFPLCDAEQSIGFPQLPDSHTIGFLLFSFNLIGKINTKWQWHIAHVDANILISENS